MDDAQPKGFPPPVRDHRTPIGTHGDGYAEAEFAWLLPAPVVPLLFPGGEPGSLCPRPPVLPSVPCGRDLDDMGVWPSASRPASPPPSRRLRARERPACRAAPPMTWPSGATFTGQWARGTRHGTGTYRDREGGVYVGEYSEGERSGHGRFTWPNGRIYEGAWHASMCHGEGIVTEANGTKRRCTWRWGNLVPRSCSPAG